MKWNWRSLNKELPHMTEDQVLQILNEELAGRRRVAILERLHRRYTSMRATRERLEILKQAQTL